MVCSTDCSKAVVPVLVLLFVALWFILRGDLLYVFPCVILFLCFSVLLVLRLPRLGKRELILVLFVRLFGLCLFRFVGFLFLLGSGKGYGLWLWHSLHFSLTFRNEEWSLANICPLRSTEFYQLSSGVIDMCSLQDAWIQFVKILWLILMNTNFCQTGNMLSGRTVAVKLSWSHAVINYWTKILNAGGQVSTFIFDFALRKLDWLQSFLHFCHSLSLPVAVFVSLIPFHCFTTETIFSTKGHNIKSL